MSLFTFGGTSPFSDSSISNVSAASRPKGTQPASHQFSKTSACMIISGFLFSFNAANHSSGLTFLNLSPYVTSQEPRLALNTECADRRQCGKCWTVLSSRSYVRKGGINPCKEIGRDLTHTTAFVTVDIRNQPGLQTPFSNSSIDVISCKSSSRARRSSTHRAAVDADWDATFCAMLQKINGFDYTSNGRSSLKMANVAFNRADDQLLRSLGLREYRSNSGCFDGITKLESQCPLINQKCSMTD